MPQYIVAGEDATADVFNRPLKTFLQETGVDPNLLTSGFAAVYNVKLAAFNGGAKGDGVNDDSGAFRAAISAAQGKGIVYVPTPSVKYKCDSPCPITTGNLTIQGDGQRLSRINSTFDGDLFPVGSDDGNHSGGVAGYNGTGPFARFYGLWLEGPNGTNTATFTNSRGIVDWENGSAIMRDVFIQKFGKGYFGIGSDIQSWHDVLITFCQYGAALHTRSDQISLYDVYFSQNDYGMSVEGLMNLRVFGGQFVFNTIADVVFDSPSVPTTANTDYREQDGTRFYGTWFESALGASMPRHVWIGRNGDNTHFVRDLKFFGCYLLLAGSTCFAEIDAGSDILFDNCTIPDGMVVATSMVKVNAVAGLSQYVTIRQCRVPTAVVKASGVMTFVQIEDTSVAGNQINQIKSNNPTLVLASHVNAGLRLQSDGQSLLTLSRNLGTEAAPNWSTLIKLNNKNIEPGSSALVWGAAVAVQANTGGLFTLSAATNIAAVIGAPSVPPVAGQTHRITFHIKNTSGGALGTLIAWNAIYKLNGAWVNPASGLTRSITFVYNPVDTLYYEESRTGDM